MMKNSLRYISISHKTASVVQREKYHLNNEQKLECAEAIQRNFDDISGLLFLVTCNRTEVYFESVHTEALKLRDVLLAQILSSKDLPIGHFFEWSDKTEESARHLLEVSSGLASSVLGDAEIIHQIKMAYRQSCEQNLQGSLLERCMQTVFKTHKRISNETSFRDGTTSVAYKTLKLIAHSFDKSTRGSIKILFVGAGDIVKQLFNYNNKFGFNSVYVANRTKERAKDLVQSFGGKTYDWDRVRLNEFADFDVIVSAVSNCPDLINQVGKRSQNMLLIDLAVPGNISKQLANQSNIIFYDLDTISTVLNATQSKRLTEIGKVEAIIFEEHKEYSAWLDKATFREFLASYKQEVNQWVVAHLEKVGHITKSEVAQIATNRIVRRYLKQPGKRIPEREMELIVEDHL